MLLTHKCTKINGVIIICLHYLVHVQQFGGISSKVSFKDKHSANLSL